MALQTDIWRSLVKDEAKTTQSDGDNENRVIFILVSKIPVALVTLE